MLRIKYNQLFRLPAVVTCLPRLVTLELSGNQINKLDSSVAKVGTHQVWFLLPVQFAACRAYD
jgi:Leucine-rich repeat (LRR) protein